MGAVVTLSPDRKTPDAHSAASKPREGWVCPKCGSVYAPTWFECVRCKPKGNVSGWSPPPSAVPERFRSTSTPKIGGQHG